MAALWIATNFTVGAGSPIQQHLPTFTYMLMVVGFYYAYPFIAFVADPKHRSDIRFDFNPQGVRYRFAEREGTLAWSDLSHAVETSGFYVLALPNRMRVALPKSEFGPGEEQRVRLLAATSGVALRG
jgi:hypothetical protein